MSDSDTYLNERPHSTAHKELILTDMGVIGECGVYLNTEDKTHSHHSSTTGANQPLVEFSSVQFSRLVISDSCDLMDYSTPGLLVHHQLLEFTQTHVH